MPRGVSATCEIRAPDFLGEIRRTRPSECGLRLLRAKVLFNFSLRFREARLLLRSLLVIAVVAVLSGYLSHLESAQAERHAHRDSHGAAWVRTVDGWEPSSVLTADSLSEGSPTLHPLLVAGFQLGASVFVLLAFPYRKF